MNGVDLLVLGGTGLAGRAIVTAARTRGLNVVTLARSGDISVDIRDQTALHRALDEIGARIVINAAAIVSAPQCEENPADAWQVNARPAAIVAEHGRAVGRRTLHISTDHFYCGDGARRHAETDPIRLVNEYARTKYAAEAFALTQADALVLRTNFVGWPSPRGTSFAEWAMNVVETNPAADLFDDQFVSSLDVWTLAEAMIDLALGKAVGVMNLAASEVFSKARFVEELARQSGRPVTNTRRASVAEQSTVRADSLGLDVSLAESILGHTLPDLEGVVASLIAHLKDRRS
jgi:dTDP-4-dehydrorhamnose reductase